MKKRFEKSKSPTARHDWLKAASKRSHTIQDLPDIIIDAVRSAKMDKRHDQLDKLLTEAQHD